MTYPRILPPSRPPPTPAQLERQRLARVDARMDKFCADLDRLVEREDDDLSSRIYQAALDKQVGVEELEGWLLRCARVLERMRLDIRRPHVVSRVAAPEGQDGDAIRARERAARYFGRIGVPERMILDLAACLLEHGHVTPPAAAARGIVLHASSAAKPARPLLEERSRAVLDQALVQVKETQSLQRLGESLRWGGTAVLTCLFVITGKIVFVPLLVVLFLMTWMLVAKRTIHLEADEMALREHDPVPPLPELLERDMTEPPPTRGALPGRPLDEAGVLEAVAKWQAIGEVVRKAGIEMKDVPLELGRSLRTVPPENRATTPTALQQVSVHPFSGEVWNRIRLGTRREKNGEGRICFCCRTDHAGIVEGRNVCAACLEAIEQQRCPLCGTPREQDDAAWWRETLERRPRLAFVARARKLCSRCVEDQCRLG